MGSADFPCVQMSSFIAQKKCPMKTACFFDFPWAWVQWEAVVFAALLLLN